MFQTLSVSCYTGLHHPNRPCTVGNSPSANNVNGRCMPSPPPKPFYPDLDSEQDVDPKPFKTTRNSTGYMGVAKKTFSGGEVVYIAHSKESRTRKHVFAIK
jgi:hypothetical protein